MAVLIELVLVHQSVKSHSGYAQLSGRLRNVFVVAIKGCLNRFSFSLLHDLLQREKWTPIRAVGLSMGKRYPSHCTQNWIGAVRPIKRTRLIVVRSASVKKGNPNIAPALAAGDGEKKIRFEGSTSVLNTKSLMNCPDPILLVNVSVTWSVAPSANVAVIHGEAAVGRRAVDDGIQIKRDGGRMTPGQLPANASIATSFKSLRMVFSSRLYAVKH